MVEVSVEGKVFKFDAPISVGRILKELGFLPMEVLVIDNDKLLTRDVVLREDRKITIKVVYSKG
jgi:sulfur carrier protein